VTFANAAAFLTGAAPARILSASLESSAIGEQLPLRCGMLNPERDELLRAIVAADLALRPDRERFRVQRLESHAGPLLRTAASSASASAIRESAIVKILRT
jgi:hypothetical protein